MLLFGVSCGGGSFCDRFQGVFDSYVNKVRPCNANPRRVTFDKAACTAVSRVSCTNAENDLLNKYLDCYDKIPTCSPQTSQAFLDQSNACDAWLNGVSAQCRAVVPRTP